MNILICDDSRNFTASFSKLLRQVFAQQREQVSVNCVRTGAEALKYIRKHCPAVLFLDIDMPRMDGFAVANQISTLEERPIIVFVSGFEHLVFESFGFQPYWFLRKSHLEELAPLVKRIVANFTAKCLTYTIMNGRNEVRVLLSAIRFFEANGHYVVVHTDKPPLRVKARLSEIENDLKHVYFVRCHAGFLVNCCFVKVVSKTKLLLTDGTTIPVSRSKAEQTQSVFMSYMRSLRL